MSLKEETQLKTRDSGAGDATRSCHFLSRINFCLSKQVDFELIKWRLQVKIFSQSEKGYKNKLFQKLSQELFPVLEHDTELINVCIVEYRRVHELFLMHITRTYLKSYPFVQSAKEQVAIRLKSTTAHPNRVGRLLRHKKPFNRSFRLFGQDFNNPLKRFCTLS